MALLADEVVVIEIVDNLYVDPNHFRGTEARSGWSSRVKSLLRGAASCTHLMEMLIPKIFWTIPPMTMSRERMPSMKLPGLNPLLDAHAASCDRIVSFFAVGPAGLLPPATTSFGKPRTRLESAWKLT